MELIFKRPQNKLPFLGLLFESEYQATRTNNEAVLLGIPFQMKIDFLGNSVTIRVTSQEPNFFYMYQEHIKCDSKKFQEWRLYSPEPYNFGHIVTDLDKHRVVKTPDHQKLFVLRITRVSVEYEY